jgi:hypothetical protein
MTHSPEALRAPAVDTPADIHASNLDQAAGILDRRGYPPVAKEVRAAAIALRSLASASDGEMETTLIQRLVNVDDALASEAADTIVGQRGVIAKLKATIARLSAPAPNEKVVDALPLPVARDMLKMALRENAALTSSNARLTEKVKALEEARVDIESAAISLTDMVIEWVDGGERTGADWRSGLRKIIELRLSRLLTHLTSLPKAEEEAR